MKRILTLLLCVFACGLFAAENPMMTVKNSAVTGIDAVLTAASQDETILTAPNRKMDLAVAYGLAYLKKTAEPTWDGYFTIVSNKAKELGVEDRLAYTGNIFEVLRPWWIGSKCTKALIDPAIAYIAAHPHDNFVDKAAQLAFDVKEYTVCLEWAAKNKRSLASAFRSYIALGQADAAFTYYYDGLEKEQWPASTARSLFPEVWKEVLKKYGKDAAKLAEYKALNAQYASQYTSKLYDSADPSKSPWRPLVTILTAQSK